MNEKRNKGGRAVVTLICSLLISAGFFGGFAYIYFTTRGATPVDETVLLLAKVFVMAGIFFLIMPLLFTVPQIINGKKSKGGTVSTGPNDIFNEANMRAALEKYIPQGETLVAAVRAAGQESAVYCAFEGCDLTEESLVPVQDGKTINIKKGKFSTYDLYVGITQNYLVVADCRPFRYYYEFNREPVAADTDIQVVTEEIFLCDIGKCFPLENIESLQAKNAMAGSMKWVITLKNGGYFKLMIPKNGDLGGGMPRHQEYRDAILEALSKKRV